MRQANDDGLKKAKELPYFDGDFWPNALEDSIKELDQEEEERKTAAAAAAAETASQEVQTCFKESSVNFIIIFIYIFNCITFRHKPYGVRNKKVHITQLSSNIRSCKIRRKIII